MPILNLDTRARLYQLSFGQIQVLIDSGRLGEALSELERMVAADPDRAEGHNDLAVLYHSVGRLTDAEREIRRALELDPQNTEAQDNRAAIANAIDARLPSPSPSPTTVTATPTAAPAPAIALVAAAPAAPPPSGALVYQDFLRAAEALVAAGEIDAAVAEIERFVQREPASSEAWNDLGVLHHGAGKLEAARAALTVALTIDGNDDQTRRNLVSVLLEMGRTDQAARTLEPVLTRNPRDVAGLILAGDISQAIQQTSDARSFYQSALTIDPSNAELAAKLAARPPAPVAAPASAPRVLEYDPRPGQPLPDGWFDVVSCQTPLDRLPDPIGALREMARALKPGGMLRFDLGCRLEATKSTTAAAERDVRAAGQPDASATRARPAAYVG